MWVFFRMMSPPVKRRVLFSAAALLLLLVVFGVWAGWQAYQVNRHLNAAVSAATAVKNAVQSGDSDRVQRELTSLQQASAAAEERTSGVTWSVLTALPALGDDAEGIRATSQVLDHLAADGVAPLIEVSDRMEELLPRNGAVDLATVRALQEPIATAQAAFADADQRLAAQDDSGFVHRFRSKFTELRRQVTQADSAMSAARTTADLLPDALGAAEPRNYLLVFQNNAEIRATGGLPGALSELRAADGKVEVVRQTTATALTPVPQPVLPLTAPERELYTDALGRYFGDTTFTPDVARNSELMQAWWQREFPQSSIDGVILLDTVSLSYVLEATGPITVQGVRLTSDNLVEELLHKVYLRFEDPLAQDAFFAEVSRTAFEHFTTGASNGVGLVQALARGVDEQRMFVHLFDAAEQQQVVGTPVAGEFRTDPKQAEPQIQVTLNDGTGSKMSYFLRYDASVEATSCRGGVQRYAAKMRLRSTAPSDAASLPAAITGGGNYGVEPGSQVVTLRVFGPAAGGIGRFTLNAKPTEMITLTERNRPVAMTYLQLDPGQTVDLAWTMTGGAGQVGAADFSVTPTIEAKDNAITVASACR